VFEYLKKGGVSGCLADRLPPKNRIRIRHGEQE